MGLEPFALPSDEPAICRGCARCGAVLDVTLEDHLVCPRCGRVRVWTVSVNGRLVAAGRELPRAGIGIWLAGDLDELRPTSLRGPAAACGGWNEDVDTGDRARLLDNEQADYLRRALKAAPPAEELLAVAPPRPTQD